MTVRFQNLRRLVIVGCLPFFGSHAGAQLAANSPFLPAQNSGPAAPTAGASLEYRAFLEDRDGRLFRVFDPAQKKGAWVRLNEHEANLDFTLKQHDEGNDTVTVERQGRSMTLELRKPKVISSGSAAAQAMMPPPVAPANQMPAAVTQSVVLNPSPADEANRLNAVATEIQRRRALRDQATQQINTNGLPQIDAQLPPKNLQPQTQQPPVPQPSGPPSSRLRPEKIPQQPR